MEAKPHPQQAQRLNALYSYEILDTDREKDFDDIVQLAAKICGTAISVINIIDADRQWFKAETGLGVRETPLATSICSHIILEHDFVEIHDMLEDPRMVDNPLCCSDPGLRFYAGALLKTEEGLPLGTLCVLDYEPGELTPLQRDTIRVLARQVMAQLEMRKALKTAEVLRQEVDHRVKNSLQTVASVIRLQKGSLKTDEAREALETVEGRIEAVSMLHELLYQTDTNAKVDLHLYVEKLGALLHTVAPDGVTVSVSAEPMRVSSAQAAGVGTLVNELAANAFKHAYSGQPEGRFDISLRKVGDDLIELHCADNGSGMSQSDSSEETGLGMRIINMTSEQLGGPLMMTNGDEGLSVRARFPASQY